MIGSSKVLLERHEAGFDLVVALANDETECRLTLKPHVQAIDLSPRWLLDILKELEVTEGTDPEALDACCRRAGRGEPTENLLVAQGKHPEPAEDGAIEFLLRPSSDVAEFIEDDSGRIDFHETHLFENVTAGQPIALSRPAKKGMAGITVQGKPIPVRDPAPANLRAGAGAKLNEDGTVCAATIDGRVVFKAGTISVTNELVVNDVDLAVGNINFVGSVLVRGDVFDGFSVRAQKGLQVRGNVGHCRIESEGDINIGGMTGLEGEGSIKCGGNLKARYLHEVTVESQGDVYVKNEVMNCKIMACGAISVPGLIAGGEYIALSGIEAGTVGTDAGVITRLRAGLDYHDLGRINELAAELKDVKQREARLIVRIRRLARPEDRKTASQHERDIFEKTRAALREVIRRRQKIQTELASLLKAGSDLASAKINVRKEINRGTTMTLGSTSEKIEEERKGLVSVIELAGRGLQFLKMTPLSKKARELEEEFLAREKAAKEAERAKREQQGLPT